MPDPSVYPDLEELTQLDSGFGLVVCEPVRKGGDESLAHFGSGCARWLQLVVGGHGELGRTPQWSAIERGWRRLGTTRPTAAQAAGLADHLGVTHVAVGEVAKAGSGMALSYQLYEVPARTPLGEPVTASGSEEEVLAALPEMAAALARALGVVRTQVPEGVGETPEEIRLLGSLPWLPGAANVGPRGMQLKPLADEAIRQRTDGGRRATRPHLPLLGTLLYMIYRGDCKDQMGVIGIVRPLALGSLENAVLLGMLGRSVYRSGWRDASHLPRDLLRQNLERFPNNHLYHTADAYFHRVGQDHHQARLAAAQAVRCATGNPIAWGVLGEVISD